jgi:membrane peptidoglycan carboxypeptidase
MLQKAIREGTGISIATRYGLDIPLAGKTGTSQNYSDAWFCSLYTRDSSCYNGQELRQGLFIITTYLWLGQYPGPSTCGTHIKKGGFRQAAF